MRIVKGILIALVVLVAALVAIGFALPDKAHVERSIVIDAPQANIFTLLNSFRRFEAWSPWAAQDPDMQITLSGPVRGVGARYEWQGNDAVGSGSQEITLSEPYNRIEVALDFGAQGQGLAYYALEPEGASTRVTWGFDTDFKGNLIGRYFGLMFDSMIGPDYARGLANLKTLAEGSPKVDVAGLDAQIVETQAQAIAYVAAEADIDEAADTLAAAYGKVIAFMQAHGLTQVEAPIAVTREFNETTKHWRFEAAIPVDRSDVAVPEDSEVRIGATYAGTAIRAVHIGPYDAMEPTYNKLVAFKTLLGFEDNGDSWEQYVSDPGNTPQAELVTHVYWPVK